MVDYCPKCGQPCIDGAPCAVCETRVAEGNTLLDNAPTPRDLPDGPSFSRRLLIGGLCLLGVYQGLKHFTLAMAVSQGGAAILSPEANFGLMVAATLAAAAVAGTVNRRAEVAGLLIALAGAAGLLSADLIEHGNDYHDWSIGVTAILVVVGVLGGFAGRLMIPPSPTVPAFGLPSLREVALARRRPMRLVWWRIALGTLIVILGVLNADPIRQALTRVLAGHSGGWGSGRLISWQIGIVAAIVAGCVAGANTRAGWRQGFLAGAFGALGVIVALASRGDGESPIVGFWLEQFNLPLDARAWACVGGCIVVSTLVGGWLAAQVFPPTRRSSR